MTETVPEPMFVTNTRRLSGEIVRQRGSSPTTTSARLMLRSPPTSINETLSFSGFTTHKYRLSLVRAIGPEVIAGDAGTIDTRLPRGIAAAAPRQVAEIATSAETRIG